MEGKGGGQISKEDINTPPPLGSYPPIAGGILQKKSEKNLRISRITG